MTLYGTIQIGVVVLEPGTDLPDGTPVTVVVEQPQRPIPAEGDRLSPEEFRRRRAIFDEIISLPSESPGDAFSGAGHDQVFYGSMADGGRMVE